MVGFSTSKSLHAFRRGNLAEGFLLGGKAFKICRQRVVADESGTMFRASGSHGNRLDLVGRDEFVECGPSDAEVVGDLLRAEPFWTLGLGGVWLGG